MKFFRVFDWDRKSKGQRRGGPLFIPRKRQGSGRHDIPHRDGVFYLSINAISAVAEAIQMYRNQSLADEDFQIDEGRYVQALGQFQNATRLRLIDLTDPKELARRAIRPSEVATYDRAVTQQLSVSIHDEGADGFLWWSTLEASWTNATLFQSRIEKKIRAVERITPLSSRMEELLAAARFLCIEPSRRKQ